MSTDSRQIVIERIEPRHASSLLFMIKELASFEKMPHKVEMTEERLADDISRGAVHGFIALQDGDHPVGMTLFYMAYSTWQGQFIHMEDLYVRPEYRRRGIGLKLWVEIAKLAQKMRMKRLQWDVLDWNENALQFYHKVKSINLTKEEGWFVYRLNEDGIDELARLS